MLRQLLETPCEDEIKNTASDLLFSILIWQDRFDELGALGFPRNNDDAEQMEMYDHRDMEFLPSPEATVADMPEFPWIQPLMTVRINGKSCNMLIDTGAMATLVTSSLAEGCGLAVA